LQRATQIRNIEQPANPVRRPQIVLAEKFAPGVNSCGRNAGPPAEMKKPAVPVAQLKSWW